MTSDAKVGLLLGLVFVFIIAFLINGLPKFRKNTNNNELTTKMIGLQNGRPGIAANQRKANNELIREQVGAGGAEPVRNEQTVNLDVSVPEKALPVVDQNTSSNTVTPAESLSMQDARGLADDTVAEKHTNITYVVSDGDTLSVIAKKFYGLDEGNKLANIRLIFEANQRVIRSPDDIYVGQQLTIPPLGGRGSLDGATQKIFSDTMFETVKSIGENRLDSNAGIQAAADRYHVVCEGESLWRIAASQLGDPTRFREIARLNVDVLDDQDTIVVGMRLKLPAR